MLKSVTTKRWDKRREWLQKLHGHMSVLEIFLEQSSSEISDYIIFTRPRQTWSLELFESRLKNKLARQCDNREICLDSKEKFHQKGKKWC